MTGLRPANREELFDVVDAQDEVVSQAPRWDVHARSLLHRAVHVLVHDEAGRFFLQRRSLGKDSFPGCWDASCTGHLDAGEDYETAARRELREELGWHDVSQPLRHVTKLAASPSTGYEFIEVFLLGPAAGPFELHPEEIIEGRWIDPRALSAEMRASPEEFSGAFRFLWEEYGARISGLLPGADLKTI
jgi:isopentenyl-diphosphate delta-isomerase